MQPFSAVMAEAFFAAWRPLSVAEPRRGKRGQLPPLPLSAQM